MLESLSRLAYGLVPNESERPTMSESTPMDPMLSFKSPEALEMYEKERAMNVRDKRLSSKDSMVCACGHPLRVHHDAGVVGIERKLCTPGRQKCPCKVVRPVLSATDLRVFMARTSGVGPRHALGRGLIGLDKRGVAEAYWLENGELPEWVEPGVMGAGVHGEGTCDICLGKTEIPIFVAVDSEGGMAEGPTGIDKMVCYDCYLIWKAEMEMVNG